MYISQNFYDIGKPERIFLLSLTIQNDNYVLEKLHFKKKIEKRVSIFWEVGEVQRAAIFRLRRLGKVELSPGPNVAGY